MNTPPHSHPELWTLDAHCDTWYMKEFFRGPNLPPELKEVDHTAFFRVTPSCLKEGNIGCLFLNVGDIGLLSSSAVIDTLLTQSETEEGGIIVCYSADDVTKTVQSGKTAVIMACESSYLFLNRPDLLRNWHRLGVRVMNITHGEGQDQLGWFAETALASEIPIQAGKDLALQGTLSRFEYMQAGRDELWRSEKGLTRAGSELALEMIRLSIVCDLSHANDATFRDVMALADQTGEGKFCCTHSNCAALCNHTRNLTDAMMMELAEKGGVMGLCFYGGFIDENAPSLEKFVDHVLHALDVMGSDHVGIGTDYDGVTPDAFMAVPHPGQMNILWTALADAGVPTPILKKIAHENFLRLI